MTLRQMEYFVAVIDEGSFSRAAARLNVTQPALSQQVLALERDLGAPLLERLRRGVGVTAAGRGYLPHARAALAAARRGRRAVRDVRAGRAGELELSTVISVAVGVLLTPLLRWRQDMPDVSVRLSEFSHRRALEEFVLAGNADLAIGPMPLSWDGASVLLGSERFVLILPSDDPAARFMRPYRDGAPRAAPRSAGTLSLELLADRDWVLFDRSNGLSEIVETHLLSAGIVPRASLRSSQFVAAAALAASGMGPTLIPANVVQPDLAAIVCEPEPPLLRSLGAFARGSLEGVPEHFVEMVREHSAMLELP